MLPVTAMASAGPKLRAGFTEVPVRGDAHDVNEGEGEADHEAAEVAGLAVGGHAQDGEHEDAGQDNLDHKGADHGEAGRGGRVIAVAAEAGLGHAAEGAALAHDDMADEDEDFDESNNSDRR